MHDGRPSWTRLEILRRPDPYISILAPEDVIAYDDEARSSHRNVNGERAAVFDRGEPTQARPCPKAGRKREYKRAFVAAALIAGCVFHHSLLALHSLRASLLVYTCILVSSSILRNNGFPQYLARPFLHRLCLEPASVVRPIRAVHGRGHIQQLCCECAPSIEEGTSTIN